MNILFNDLKTITAEIREQLDAAYHRVMDSGWYVLGKEVESFEQEFAEYCKSEHCIGVANGLEALQLILKAHDIGPGDEVLVPANTFIATWLAVSHVGASPVPVEPDRETHNISAEGITGAITPKTKAIIVVHLYGQPVEMDEVNRVAEIHGIPVFEDACQAQGAKYKDKSAGSLGKAAAFSFYPVKNLGAYGDGGAITTSDSELAAKLRLLRNYGSPVKYQHDQIGCNSRLDEMQAAFLRVKLKQLDVHNSARQAQACRYSELLEGISQIELPVSSPDTLPVWHQYVIQVERRDDLVRYLHKKGIETMIHYPCSPHKTGAYDGTHGHLMLPVTEKLVEKILSLPLGMHLSQMDVEAVVKEIKGFYIND